MRGDARQRAVISKEFKFQAAHQLPNHDGECSRLHGHSYKLIVFAEGPIRSLDGSSGEGMVVDFGDLKDVYRQHIEPLVEHQYLNDTLSVERTTAENIAAWALGVFREHRSEVFAVRIHETETSMAEVSHSVL